MWQKLGTYFIIHLLDFFSDNKDSFQGKFNNGVLEREGKLRLSTSCNRTYEGKWQDGLMEGEMRIDVRNTILCADHVLSTGRRKRNLVSNFFQSTLKSDLKDVQFTQNYLFWVKALL